MEREIAWDDGALINFEKALDWISDDSLMQAENVESAILTNLDMALEDPERFGLDRFKVDNDGTYRAFETHSYRLAFTYDDEKLKILRFRHVRQEPEFY